MAAFTVAIDRYTGTQEKSAEFIPVVAWEKLAESYKSYLAKGCRVLFEGRINVRSYDTTDASAGE